MTSPEIQNLLSQRAGPEIYDFGDPNGTLTPQNPWERVGPPLPVGFGEAGGRSDPPKSTISGPSLKNKDLGPLGLRHTRERKSAYKGRGLQLSLG